jgi:hypothetical protein
MIRSEQINELATALAKAQGEFPSIPKNKVVDFTDKNGRRVYYKYADLADVISATTPALSKHGLSVSQDLIYLEKELCLETTLMHSSGQFKTGIVPLKMFDKAQEQGGEITYYRRYTLCGAIGVQSDEDTDGGNLPAPEPKKAKPIPSANPIQAVKPTVKAATKTVTEVQAATVEPEAKPVEDNSKLLNELKAAVKKGGWEPSHVTAYIGSTYGKKLSKDLTNAEIDHLIKMVMIYKPEEVGVGTGPSFDYGDNT